MDRLRSISISIIIGIALAIGFQSSLWMLPILALAVFFYQLNALNVRERFLSATIVSGVWFGIHVFWMVSLGFDAWILLVIVCMLPWLLIISYAIPTRGWGTFILPIGLVFVIEWLRSSLPWNGFPWGLLAYSQVDGPLVWISRIGGQELVGSAVVICAVSVWQISTRGEVKKALTCLALVGVLATLGFLSGNEPTATTRIAVIQGSVPTDSPDLKTQQRRVLANHVRITTQLSQDVASGVQKKPDLVIWPENATDLDPVNNSMARNQIQAVVNKIQTPVLIGGVTWQQNPYGPRNAGLLWFPKSGINSIYAKKQLVPFGEYIPIRDLIKNRVGRLSQIPNDFVPGKSSGVFEFQGYRFGDVICIEVAYQDHLRTLVNEGANFLTVQTNNATYIHRGQAWQQFAIARFRAIEHTRSTAIASTTGFSGIVGADGKVQAITDEGQAKYLIGNINLYSHINFTDSHSYAVPSLFLIGYLWFLMARVITMMRSRNQANNLSH